MYILDDATRVVLRSKEYINACYIEVCEIIQTYYTKQIIHFVFYIHKFNKTKINLIKTYLNAKRQLSDAVFNHEQHIFFCLLGPWWLFQIIYRMSR